MNGIARWAVPSVGLALRASVLILFHLRSAGYTNYPWPTEQEFVSAFNRGGALAIFTGL
jgi:hypothetical protein